MKTLDIIIRVFLYCILDCCKKNPIVAFFFWGALLLLAFLAFEFISTYSLSLDIEKR